MEINSVSRVILCLFIEYLKLAAFSIGIFNHEFKSKKICILVFPLVIATNIILFFKLDIDGIMNFICGISTVLSYILVMKGKHRILYPIFAFAFISCFDDIFTRVLCVFFENIDMLLIYIISSSVIMLIIFLIVNKLRKKYKSSYDIDRKYIIILIIGQMFALAYFEISQYSTDKNTRMLAVAVICFLIAVETILAYTISSRNYYKSSLEMNQKLMSSQEQYYRMLLNQEQETRKFRHDISNHIICITALLKENKNEEALKYVNKLNDRVSQLKSGIKTGNILVNAIANDIIQKYPDVVFKWNGGIPEKLNISDIDICTIFSNLLDNAFAAASVVKKDKTVSVIIKSISGNLMISIENTTENKIKTENGKFITTKSDKKNHGFGTQNVKIAVDSLKGSVEYSCDNGIFEVDVLIPFAFSID